jgi:hypothetical protein
MVIGFKDMATESNVVNPAGRAGDAAGAAEDEVIQIGRVYHDPAVPELVCRYPNDPIVTLLSKAPREVVVSLDGRPRRVAVRNGDLARPGKQYLMLRDGDDKGLWLLLEPGESLE